MTEQEVREKLGLKDPDEILLEARLQFPARTEGMTQTTRFRMLDRQTGRTTNMMVRALSRLSVDIEVAYFVFPTCHMADVFNQEAKDALTKLGLGITKRIVCMNQSKAHEQRDWTPRYYGERSDLFYDHTCHEKWAF